MMHDKPPNTHWIAFSSVPTFSGAPLSELILVPFFSEYYRYLCQCGCYLGRYVTYSVENATIVSCRQAFQELLICRGKAVVGFITAGPLRIDDTISSKICYARAMIIHTRVSPPTT